MPTVRTSRHTIFIVTRESCERPSTKPAKALSNSASCSSVAGLHFMETLCNCSPTRPSRYSRTDWPDPDLLRCCGPWYRNFGEDGFGLIDKLAILAMGAKFQSTWVLA